MKRNKALLLALLILKKRELQQTPENRKHKLWVRKILTERNRKGEYHLIHE